MKNFKNTSSARRSKPMFLALAIALASVSGCKSQSGGGDSNVTLPGSPATPAAAPSTPTPTPAPSPSPSPTPTPAPVPAGSLEGLPSIPSNFNVDDYLVPSWGHGDIPVSAAPDVVGAFRFQCTPSHNAYDDPIVYPGQPGKSHLHTFFGNTGADANSTYESLRTTGESTCNNILNRSAYWIPSMMNGEGQVVMPNRVTIYYKRRPDTDPECQRMGKACVALPRGLRYVFGYNMQDPANGSPFYLNCQGEGSTPGKYANIPEVAPNCPSGAELGAIISAPPCWDGVNLDSPDHRSHMAQASYGDWGYLKCPDTHPYVIPTFTLGAWYTTDDTLDRTGNLDPMTKTWHFSSDRMEGMMPHTPGSTFHSDWFGAWDDSVMEKWTTNCINKLLNCSGGDLGNGEQLKLFDGYTTVADPRLVAPPIRT
ncbi:DUF1996 domain-containing protein [Parasphingorhabdus sp.]|uniref:DUF1996 domain-containing protein n=1 Tax=Parasphingorhabdus sp. TaxID=2709688 RepID=UPI003BAE71A8